jgi:hypothetical protein
MGTVPLARWRRRFRRFAAVAPPSDAVNHDTLMIVPSGERLAALTSDRERCGFRQL